MMLNQSFRFVIISDPHLRELQGMDRFLRVMEYLESQKSNLAFVQILGDVMHPESPAQFKRTMEEFDLPYRITLGNQDAGELKEYHDLWGPMNYSFEYGNCLFISVFNALPALDDPSVAYGVIDEATFEWLTDILSQSRENGHYVKTFLFAHIPPLKPGSPMGLGWRMNEETTDRWYDLCREFHVDAAFYAHLHHNEVFELDDTWHITTPSLNWNFNISFGNDPSDWYPVEYNGYRVVTITNEEMKDELCWVERRFEPIPETWEHPTEGRWVKSM